MVSIGGWTGKTEPSSERCTVSVEARLGESTEQFLAKWQQARTS